MGDIKYYKVFEYFNVVFVLYELNYYLSNFEMHFVNKLMTTSMFLNDISSVIQNRIVA